MNFDEARRRYETDPEFHTLVDYIFHLAYTLKYTPGEVRDAATFASLKVEGMLMRLTNCQETIGISPWRE